MLGLTKTRPKRFDLPKQKGGEGSIAQWLAVSILPEPATSGSIPRGPKMKIAVDQIFQTLPCVASVSDSANDFSLEPLIVSEKNVNVAEVNQRVGANRCGNVLNLFPSSDSALKCLGDTLA